MICASLTRFLSPLSVASGKVGATGNFVRIGATGSRRDIHRYVPVHNEPPPKDRCRPDRSGPASLRRQFAHGERYAARAADPQRLRQPASLAPQRFQSRTELSSPRGCGRGRLDRLRRSALQQTVVARSSVVADVQRSAIERIDRRRLPAESRSANCGHAHPRSSGAAQHCGRKPAAAIAASIGRLRRCTASRQSAVSSAKKHAEPVGYGLQRFVGARLLGPLSPAGSVGPRRTGCLGRRLQRRHRTVAGRSGRQLRAISHLPATAGVRTAKRRRRSKAR